MIQPPRAVRIFAHRAPVDMRKSFDTLAAVVRLEMANDVMAGDVFVFVGRRRRHAKVLWWDGTGMVLVAKRLVKGRFGAPWDREGDGAIRWTTTELALFLDGSDLIAKHEVSPRAWDPKERRVVFQ